MSGGTKMVDYNKGTISTKDLLVATSLATACSFKLPAPPTVILAGHCIRRRRLTHLETHPCHGTRRNEQVNAREGFES